MRHTIQHWRWWRIQQHWAHSTWAAEATYLCCVWHGCCLNVTIPILNWFRYSSADMHIVLIRVICIWQSIERTLFSPHMHFQCKNPSNMRIGKKKVQPKYRDSDVIYTFEHVRTAVDIRKTFICWMCNAELTCVRRLACKRQSTAERHRFSQSVWCLAVVKSCSEWCKNCISEIVSTQEISSFRWRMPSAYL